LVPVLFSFYIQGVLKLKKNNSDAERLICTGLNERATDVASNDKTFVFWECTKDVWSRFEDFKKSKTC